MILLLLKHHYLIAQIILQSLGSLGRLFALGFGCLWAQGVGLWGVLGAAGWGWSLVNGGARAVCEGGGGVGGGVRGGTLFVEGEGAVTFEETACLVVALGGIDSLVGYLRGWTNSNSLFNTLALA